MWKKICGTQKTKTGLVSRSLSNRNSYLYISKDMYKNIHSKNILNSPTLETTQLSIKYTKQTNRALWYSHDIIPHNEKELTTTICNIMDKSQKR